MTDTKTKDAKERKTDYHKQSVEADRCLASIVQIEKLSPIEKAQNIELAQVLGWECVVTKNQFAVGDKAIYFSIDAVMNPDDKHFAFLEGKKLKPKKILGVLSQGMLKPLSILSDDGLDEKDASLDSDVTAKLGVRKFVASTEMDIYNKSTTGDVSVMIPFPPFVPKTDEERVQNVPRVLKNIVGQNVVITRKEDGTSTTYALVYKKKKGETDEGKEENTKQCNASTKDEKETGTEFFVCSRNRTVYFNVEDGDQVERKDSKSGKEFKSLGNDQCYFDMAQKYDIERKMKALSDKKSIAIQGEIVGPKVNGNRMKLKGIDFFVFNIWDIESQKYLDWSNVTRICGELGLKTVPVVYKGPFLEKWNSVAALNTLAEEQTYAKDVAAEGIVVKTDGAPLRHSFKVIATSYLLKLN